jgi:hypothetical protein
MKRIELGCPGHFICAKDCRWRRHTQVGNYRISSVGDLYYQSKPNKRQTIGATGYFETMVFKTTNKPEKGNEGCGCCAVAQWTDVDGERYETAGEAQAGHERYVKKYMRKIESKKRVMTRS